MVSTRKKRQSSKRLLSQLDDFDQDVIIGNTTSERRENVLVNEGVDDQNFTGGTSNVSSIVNENALNVKTLERCFNERIDREMSNIVDTVEDRIQNAVLTAIDNIVTPKIELAIRSINASSGRDVTSVSGNSERRDHERMNTSFGSASENNGTLGMTNANDETRCNPHDRVGELSVAGTQFDQQSPAHHVVSGGSTESHHMNPLKTCIFKIVLLQLLWLKLSLQLISFQAKAPKYRPSKRYKTYQRVIYTFHRFFSLSQR